MKDQSIGPRVNNCYGCISEGKEKCECCNTKTDLLQTIKDKVAEAHGCIHWQHFLDRAQISIIHRAIDEVCKRYAFEVAKASLKEASIKARLSNGLTGAGDNLDLVIIDRNTITDESNIKL